MSPGPSAPKNKEDTDYIPYQHLSQSTRAFQIDKLLRVRQLDVHIAIHAHQPAFVFCLAPFQAHEDVLIDPVGEQRGLERSLEET